MEQTTVSNERYEMIAVDTSFMNIKRMMLFIGVKKPMDLNGLLAIVKECMEPYRNANDIIMADVQRFGDGKSMNKELMKVQWVTPLLDEIKVKPYKNNDGNGYYWEAKAPELMDSEHYAMAAGFANRLSLHGDFIVSRLIKGIRNLRYSNQKERIKDRSYKDAYEESLKKKK